MRDDTTEIKHNIIANITDTLRDEKQFAVNRTDSILVKDSIIAPNFYKESWITENLEVHKRNKWQLLAAGSLGTTLVQSVCKFMKVTILLMICLLVRTSQQTQPTLLRSISRYGKTMQRATSHIPGRPYYRKCSHGRYCRPQ